LIPRNEGGVGLLSSCTVEQISVLGFVSRNPSVIERKRELLKSIDGASLVEYYDGLRSKYEQVSILDSTTVMRSSKVGYYIRRNKNNLLSNLEFLKGC
jgi:hypothetical protein